MEGAASMQDKIPQDRRVAPRSAAGFLISYTDVAETDPNRILGIAVSIDLNEFGLKLQSTEPIPLGEKYRFSVALGDDLVDAVGKVVHVERALNGTFEMGVEFIEIYARHIETIKKHVADRSEIG
ncbi:MAG TPA: PilZ domain-containing protein [Planctomycetes bacterium]|nr:PilZ domain-containing protein [Planctomycetota bacterium]